MAFALDGDDNSIDTSTFLFGADGSIGHTAKSSYLPSFGSPGNFDATTNREHYVNAFRDMITDSLDILLDVLPHPYGRPSYSKVESTVYGSLSLSGVLNGLFAKTNTLFGVLSGAQSLSAGAVATDFDVSVDAYNGEVDDVFWNLLQGQFPNVLQYANLSFSNAYFRPKGVIYGYSTVNATYDLQFAGDQDYYSSSGADVIYFGSQITRQVTGYKGSDFLIFSKSGGNALDSQGSDIYVFLGDDGHLAFSEYSTNRVVTKNTFGETVLYAFATGERDTVTGVERIDFIDGTIAFDTAGHAGQAYRLYQAAFGRTPDTAGLGYWVRQLDNGYGDLAWMAHNFIISQEFRATYGSPETVSNSSFLNLVYQNVLGRAPDAGGKAYWLAQLDSGFDRARVLASFSESAENQNNVYDDIANGIWFV